MLFLEFYCILVTLLLIFGIIYIVYRHKTKVRTSVLYVADLTEIIVRNLKTYNNEMEQLVRQFHSLRMLTKDICKQLGIENVMDEYTKIKFEKVREADDEDDEIGSFSE